MTDRSIPVQVAEIKADVQHIKDEKLPERVRGLEAWRALLLGIGTALILAGGVVSFLFGEAIKKALGGP